MKLNSLILPACLAALLLAASGCTAGKETAKVEAPKPEPAKTADASEPAKEKTEELVGTAGYDAARAKAKKDGTLLMVKFEADWCGPCNDMTEAMKSDIVLAEEMKNYTVFHVDIDNPKNKEIAARFYPDSGIPFVIVLRPGDESRVTDFLGFDTGAMLARELKAARDKA